MSVELPDTSPRFEDGFDALILRRLAELLEVAVVTTGYDLRRGKAPALRANGKVAAIAAAVASTTLLYANGARRGCAVYNDSTATLYLKLGPAASSEDWSVSLADGDYYEPPAGYRGEISGVWSAANGQARVTEFE
jgi:hypothetical protein